MLQTVSFAALSVVGVIGAAPLLLTPAKGEVIHVGDRSAGVVARLERRPVVPLVGAASHVTARDVVLAIDRGPLHFRYGLVWETRKHQELGASVAAWEQDDPAPAYLHISGRTPAARSGGHESFIIVLPAGRHDTVRAEVDVAADGSAMLKPGSLALLAEGHGG